MFQHIIKFDWLSLRANRTGVLILGISALMIGFALWTGAKRIDFQKNTLDQIAQQEKSDYAHYRKIISVVNAGQQFDGGHFGDPTNPFFFGNRMGARYVTLPAAPLAAISTGQSDLQPYYYKLTLSKRQALFHSEELENPQILYNGNFDMSFVIIFLLPLLIIGLTYNVVSSEREQGTLALLMAETTAFSDVVRARYVFRYGLLNGFISLFMLIGMPFFGIQWWSALSETGYVLLVLWLYSAFWFALSFWINSWGKNSGYNAAVLTGAWLGLVLLVPTLLAAYVNQAHPMPSRLDLITKTREIGDKINKESEKSLNRFYEEHVEFKADSTKFNPKDENAKRLYSRLELELALENEVKKFDIANTQRQEVVNRYRFLSPAIFVQQSLNDASGTGENRFAQFEQQVTNFHKAYRDYFAPLVYKQSKFTIANLEGVPTYPYPATSTSIFSEENTANLIFLFVLTGVFSLLAAVRVRRVNLAFG